MKLKIFAIAVMTTIINSCDGNFSQSASAQTNIQEPVVLIKTTEGDLKIKLYNETPLHRDNFLKLVETDYYDGVLFHRVIKNFMIQTGDPDSINAREGAMLGSGGPDYTIEAEFAYPKLFHKRGALCAARQSDQVNPERRSSGSQFYIVTGKKYKESEIRPMEQQMQQQQLQTIFQALCMENRDTIIALQEKSDNAGLQKLQDELVAKTEERAKEMDIHFRFTKEQVEAYTTIGGTPFLDNQYTVFGEVIEGMEVVDKIEKTRTDSNDRPKENIKILSMELEK